LSGITIILYWTKSQNTGHLATLVTAGKVLCLAKHDWLRSCQLGCRLYIGVLQWSFIISSLIRLLCPAGQC